MQLSSPDNNYTINMAKQNNNIVMHGLSGQIGKQLVVKQYAYGEVISKFPDMSNIKPSKKQEEKRSKFTEAVAYAQSVLNDTEKKLAYQKMLEPGQKVYYVALKEYLQSH